MRKVLCHFALALMTFLTFSCEHKMLYYEDYASSMVEVVFDWSLASTANPEGMSVYFFPKSGNAPLRYDFSGKKGGQIRLPVGFYDIVFLNNDTESILFRNIDFFESFELYTRNSSLVEPLGIRSVPLPTAVNPLQLPVLLDADRIYGGRKSDFELEAFAEKTTIVLTPYETTSNYTVEVRNAENLQYIHGVSASLSGLASSYLMGANRLSEKAAIVPFPATHDGKTTINAHLTTFGVASTGPPHEHTLTIYVILADGSKSFYTFDVTDQVRNAPDPHNVHLIINGLSLPKPIVNGSGLQPELSDWKGEEVEIQL